MPVAAFLQFVGFILVALNTAVAAFAIYVIQTGGRDVQDVFYRAVDQMNLTPNMVLIAAIVLAWVVVSLPGFLLLANGLSTEAQLTQTNDAKETRKKLDEMAASLAALKTAAIDGNDLLREIKDKPTKGGWMAG